MNTVNEESKSAAIKTLAIIGFVAAIVICLWIAVTMIRFIPGAFSSLASITDSLYGAGAGLTMKTENDVVNSGEAFTLFWNPVRSEGSYTFSYRCVEGISAELRDITGEIAKISCGENTEVAFGALPRTEQKTEVVFTSEKQRFTDVSYIFAFTKDGEEKPVYERTGVVTVVNATIPQAGAVAGAKDDTSKKPVSRPTPTPKPTPVAPKPTAPVYYKSVPVETTSLPVSDPKGQTDLEVTLIGVGELRGSTFTPMSTLDAGETAVMRFAVKNIGTKTSGQWTYAASFPAMDDDSITSAKQAPLLPGERATISLTFTVTENTGSETARVSVSSNGDVKSSNNTASRSVRIEN